MTRKPKIRKKAICAPEFLNNPADYQKSFSRGMRVDLGNLAILFISGTASIDKNGKSIHKGDFTKQANHTFKNLTALLKSEGATWHDIVQTRFYLKSMRYYSEFNNVRNKFFKLQSLSPFPASVCVEAKLCRPELLIEAEAIALINNKRL